MADCGECPVWQWLSRSHQFLTGFLELLGLGLCHNRWHLAQRCPCLLRLRPALPCLGHRIYQRHRVQVLPSLLPESRLLGLWTEVLRVSLLERLSGLLGGSLRVRVVLLPWLFSTIITLPRLRLVRHLFPLH